MNYNVNAGKPKYGVAIMRNQIRDCKIYLFNQELEAIHKLREEYDKILSEAKECELDYLVHPSFYGNNFSINGFHLYAGNIYPICRTNGDDLNGHYAVILSYSFNSDGAVYLFDTEEKATGFYKECLKSEEQEEKNSADFLEKIATLQREKHGYVCKHGFDSMNKPYVDYCYYTVVAVAENEKEEFVL